MRVAEVRPIGRCGRQDARHDSDPEAGRDGGGGMKLLLTSGGVTNRSIRTALVRLLGKPIDA